MKGYAMIPTWTGPLLYRRYLPLGQLLEQVRSVAGDVAGIPIFETTGLPDGMVVIVGPNGGHVAWADEAPTVAEVVIGLDVGRAP